MRSAIHFYWVAVAPGLDAAGFVAAVDGAGLPGVETGPFAAGDEGYVLTAPATGFATEVEGEASLAGDGTAFDAAVFAGGVDEMLEGFVGEGTRLGLAGAVVVGLAVTDGAVVVFAGVAALEGVDVPALGGVFLK